MKKTILTISVFLLIFTAYPNVEAASRKIITLTDGSVLKGAVIGLSEGSYILETDNLGKIEIEDTYVDSIQSEISYKIQQQDAKENTLTQTNSTTSNSNTNMQQTINAMQTKVMSDPQIMGDIHGLMQNEELMQLLQDPSLLNDLMTFDPQTIQSNPKMKQLMNNPEMQKMMQIIQQKMTQ